MPYLYSQAITTHQTGVPMLRAMFLEYPNDPAVWYLDQQYMLGDSLLVAPVFNEEGTVTYYLPKGDWYSIIDKKIRTGPGYVTETYDYFGLPALLKPGGAVAMGKGGDKVEYDWADGFKVLVNAEDGMDITVDIPHHENLGETVLSLRIQASGSEASVDVVSGKAASAWELVVVNSKVKSANGGDVSSEGVVSVAPGASKVTIAL